MADGMKAAALPVSDRRRDMVAAFVQNFIFSGCFHKKYCSLEIEITV